MFDPAAMGTLLIGFNAERAEAQGLRRRHPVAAPAPGRKPLGIRLTLARGLRRAAALLDRPTVGEATN